MVQQLAVAVAVAGLLRSVLAACAAAAAAAAILVRAAAPDDVTLLGRAADA